MRCALTGLQDGSALDKQVRCPEPNGFTLFEMLVGLTILAVAMVALFNAFSSGLQAGAVVRSHSRALIVAQSLIADASASRSKPARQVQGQTNGMRWIVTSLPATGPLSYIDETENWQLYQVLATVFHTNGRRVELRTLKLARANE